MQRPPQSTRGHASSGSGRLWASVREKDVTVPRIDRRAARTHRALGRALLSLTRARGYAGVRVSDICTAADVGRSTFYAHYADKDDLKRRAMGAHLRAAVATAIEDGASADPLGFSLPLFQHASAHRDLRQAVAASDGSSIAADVLDEVIRDHVRSALRDPPDPNAERTPPEVIAAFLAGAWLALCGGWLDDGASSSPEDMDMLFRRLAERVLG